MAAIEHEDQQTTLEAAMPVDVLVTPEGEAISAEHFTATALARAEFVKRTLSESVSTGQMDSITAAAKYNSWHPDSPLHPGHFS